MPAPLWAGRRPSSTADLQWCAGVDRGLILIEQLEPQVLRIELQVQSFSACLNTAR